MKGKTIVSVMVSAAAFGLTGSMLAAGLSPQNEAVRTEYNKQTESVARTEYNVQTEQTGDGIQPDQSEKALSVQVQENNGADLRMDAEMEEHAADASGEWSDAMKAYKNLLSQEEIRWANEQNLTNEGMQFMIEDLNSDGVPELIVNNNLYDREYKMKSRQSVGKYCLYSYHHSYADAIGFSHEPMTCYPGTGVFTVTYGVLKTDGTYYTSEKNYLYLKEASELDGGRHWSLSVGLKDMESDGGARFYWQGIYEKAQQDVWAAASTQAVAEEEFKAELKVLTGEVAEQELAGNWIDNTEENRDRYLR